MGFLDNILGRGKEHAPLDPGSVAARRIDARRPEIERFVGKVKDRLELVPDVDATFVFVGKPPGTFGIAWLEGGAEHNLKTLVQQHGLSAAAVQAISESLRQVYEAHQAAERHDTTVAGKRVTVTASDAFAADLRRVLRGVVS